MPFDLLRRLGLDAREGDHAFLANAVHQKDFVATRDRSIAGGSEYTFKRMDVEWEATPTMRGSLRAYLPLVFGRVARIEPTHKGSTIWLAPPEKASCATQQWFDTQVDTARNTVLEDSLQWGGNDNVTTSWTTTSLDVDGPVVKGLYVGVLNIIHPNQMQGLNADVHAYKMKAVEIRQLDQSELPSISVPYGETHSMSSSSPSSASSARDASTSPERGSPPVRVPIRKRQREYLSSAEPESPPRKVKRIFTSQEADVYLDVEASEASGSGESSGNGSSMADFIVEDGEEEEEQTRDSSGEEYDLINAVLRCYVLRVPADSIRGNGRQTVCGLYMQDYPRSLTEMRLLMPHPEPVNPDVVITCVLNKFDALVHRHFLVSLKRSAQGREASIRGAGEFRATLMGSIAEDLQLVHDPGRRNVFYCLTLECPDWSAFGWAVDAFRGLYADQRQALSELVEWQMLSWPYRKERLLWVNDDRITVFLTGNTDISIPVADDTARVPTMASLNKGSTVLVDATFHCSWNHRTQDARVFSIEAIHIQKVAENTAGGYVRDMTREAANGTGDDACDVKLEAAKDNNETLTAMRLEVKKEEYE
ncbi:hypothetical protein C8R43DRAFT_949314 [Mycena crocata]|nr:hypothetical protein C8R43DRAFT_949314 [Mycena crocata]